MLREGVRWNEKLSLWVQIVETHINPLKKVNDIRLVLVQIVETHSNSPKVNDIRLDAQCTVTVLCDYQRYCGY